MTLKLSRFLSFLTLLTLIVTPIAFAKEWHQVKTPTSGKPEIYGSYANGCFSGGIEIPIIDSNYEQVRPSRNRNYGMPAIQELIQNLNHFGATKKRVLVFGDISQPRGGPANFGHASHQTGLDMDIWFEERENHLPNSLKESLQTPSVVNPKTGEINNHWRPFYRDLLYTVATYPQTERIFVNPVIKAHLCQTESNRDWLEKLRPWYGHDSHFHIRLKCPKGSEGCIAQAPIPKGDGCDANLTNWVKDQIQWTTAPPKKMNTPAQPKPKKVMPLECHNILRQE